MGIVTVLLERADAEWLFERVRNANNSASFEGVAVGAHALNAEAALTAALSYSVHNPHADFVHVQGENLAGNGTTDGLTASTDAEAAASIKEA